MATVLRNLAIDRVDLVDKGANQAAHVVIVKRDVQKDAPSGRQTHVDTPDWMAVDKAVLDAAARNRLPDSAYAAVWTDEKGNKQRELPYKHEDGTIDATHLANAKARIDQAQMPDHVKAEARRKLEAASPKEKRVTKKNLLKRLVEVLKSDGDGDDDMEKAAPMTPEQHAEMSAHHAELGKAIDTYGDLSKLPPEHTAHKLAQLHKDLGQKLSAYAPQPGDGGLESFSSVPHVADGIGKADVEKRIAAEVKKAVDAATADLKKRTDEAEAVAKRATDERALEKHAGNLRKFRNVTVDPEKDAAVMKKLEDTDPAMYKRVTEILSSADEQLKAADVLKREIGTPLGGSAAGTAWAEIEAEAEKLVQKDGKLTKAKAIDLVMKKNPTLVKRHYEEEAAAKAS